jgi:hypothetical protein
MKLLTFVILLVAVLGLMAYTNPSMDDFGNYVRQNVIQESRKEAKNPFGQFLGSIAGGIAGSLVSSQTIRTDFLFFSLYELQLGKERLKALGIFRNFLLLEKPDFKRHRTEHAPGK